jgi:2-oxoglutarate ferredoxin oxidoreductase subunit alpha
MEHNELSIAITGAGGAGVISCGELLLEAWARSGGRGLLRKAFGPQIRGGESAALLKLTDHERYTAADHYHLLVALDWDNFARFGDEIRIDADSLVIYDSAQTPPQDIVGQGATLLPLPLGEQVAAAHPEGRVNMLALGLLGAALGLEAASLVTLAQRKLAGKPDAYRDAARACIEAGHGLSIQPAPTVPPRGGAGTWYMSGNQAAGLGAIEAGVRFVAAYPITPASDVLEWMAGALQQCGGELVQAEDELAAINMIIGAAFGGVPAFTATSGPGLALMTESIGLAVASETPITVLNVMRGGPSTGIPTKSEQSDLDIALHGLHGDAPHLVLAPLDIADCVFTTGWAVQLARHLQTAAIVLSDQFIGQSTAVVTEPRRCSALAADNVTSDNDYLRYRLTETGISTLAAPGDADRRFTADGLEHNERGTPSARDADHQRQLEKRARKLATFAFGNDWARIEGDGTLGLVSFGSASAATAEAAGLLRARGIDCRCIALRLLSPLPAEALQSALAGCDRVFVIEQNHSGQLLRHLRSVAGLSMPLHSYRRAGPVPLNGARIAATISEELES